jgi:hypothetical protein
MKSLLFILLAASLPAEELPLRAITLRSTISEVQPMTGIVFWEDSGRNKTDAIQLEFSYMRYSDIVERRSAYNWTAVEKKLNAISRRGHQAILRFHFIYPGKQTAVPAYIKALPDYHETQSTSENQPTGFADWSHPELKRFVKEFHTRFAARYDRDPRLAFVQTGFGLWAEYHIYDGPFKLGETFPDKAFQTEFLNHLAVTYNHTPWSISIDSADKRVSPVAGNDALLQLPFGLFDDSFLGKPHPKENEPDWNALDRSRYRREPAGGEISYYSDHDQKTALAPNGPHGVSFEQSAKAFHISYMIGNDQPRYQPMARIKRASLACGYKFRIKSFFANAEKSRITVANTGIAPIYRDAFVTVNGVRATASLKLLAPGKSVTFDVPGGGTDPVLTIQSDHLVPGQSIGFEADLK